MHLEKLKEIPDPLNKYRGIVLKDSKLAVELGSIKTNLYYIFYVNIDIVRWSFINL